MTEDTASSQTAESGTPELTTAELIDAWALAMADVRAVADRLGDPGWHRPSLLPGWSVGDVVAHLAWIEAVMLGRTDPPHTPDWAALPHITSGFGRLTEVPVDLRRAWSRAAVLAEFDEVIAQRHAALLAGPQDPDTPATDPFGRAATLAAVLRMRTFDTWVHSQDIRLAVGEPGGTTTLAARVAGEQIAGALGFVWAKKVAAPTGSTLVVEVTAPGVTLTRAVQRAADGKGVTVPVPADPTTRLTMTFDDFVQLGCARTRPDRNLDQARAAVRIQGDPVLGQATVSALGITP